MIGWIQYLKQENEGPAVKNRLVGDVENVQGTSPMENP